MRIVSLFTVFAALVAVAILGVRGTRFTHPPMDVFPEWLFPGMKYQSKPKSQGPSAFFADGRADRPPPANVVPAAYGPLADLYPEDNATRTGREADGAWVRGFPRTVTVDRKLLDRGRERYEISCAPCHGLVGDGNGVTKRYGMSATPTYHSDRLRQMAEGEIFNTITFGKQPANLMPAYGDKIAPADRWAIIAYVRALQRARNAAWDDVPASHRSDPSLQ